MGPRTILYTGKGGVGKTSVAAATGRAIAAAGGRVIVLSTDPAHSLADVLETPVGGRPTDVGQWYGPGHDFIRFEIDPRRLSRGATGATAAGAPVGWPRSPG